MMLAELRASFPFGVLLVTDPKSTEPIPKWSSHEQQITASETAMVVKIQHEVDGPAVVYVWDSEPRSIKATLVDTVRLNTPSRAIRVSTATGEQFVEVPVPSNSVQILILASAAQQPDELHLVLLPRHTERAPQVGGLVKAI
jgi:hypothetical protein